jgi:pilus assembly protein TadC
VSFVILSLGLGWGVLAAAPFARHARRTEVVSRLEGRPRRSWGLAVPVWLRRVSRARWTGPLGRVIAGLGARRRNARRDAALARELPVVIDLLAVAVGAGCTPYLAVGVASQWSPPAVTEHLDGIRRECALGVGFADALERGAREQPVLQPLADALLASERYGAPVGDALTRLAVEERAALRRRAEARARTVPVRLLFPLVFLVLPAFGLLSVVPVLIAGLSST